jgi:hypothetical protein
MFIEYCRYTVFKRRAFLKCEVYLDLVFFSEVFVCLCASDPSSRAQAAAGMDGERTEGREEKV